MQISGGADTIRQFLRLGVVDDFHVHVAPVLLGGGVRLFDGEIVPVDGAVAHLSYTSSSSSPA